MYHNAQKFIIAMLSFLYSLLFTVGYYVVNTATSVAGLRTMPSDVSLNCFRHCSLDICILHQSGP